MAPPPSPALGRSRLSLHRCRDIALIAFGILVKLLIGSDRHLLGHNDRSI